MLRPARILLIGSLYILFGIALAVRADDEAFCSNGRRVHGSFSLNDKGTFRFVPAGQETPLAVEMIESIRLDQSKPVPSRSGGGLRLLLADGQRISGELLKLDAECVQLRPAWSEHIDVSRNAVVALTHPPGYRTIFADDLTNGTKAWKTTADMLTYELPKPLDAGRVGVTFQEKDKTAGARCQFEAVFQTDAGLRTLAVAVTGPGEHYEIQVTDLKGESRSVRRSAGPHHLLVQFGKQSLRVTCDEDVLWYNLEQGPGGSLKQVRLNGSVAWSAFYLARAVEEPRHPPGDGEQDEVWLASDDQLFGTIGSADGRAVELGGRFGKRSVPWADIRGLYFRKQTTTPAKMEGTMVRVALRNGFGSETDILEGVLLKLDEEKFTLKHADLGELRLERKWLREVRPIVDRK